MSHGQLMTAAKFINIPSSKVTLDLYLDFKLSVEVP